MMSNVPEALTSCEPRRLSRAATCSRGRPAPRRGARRRCPAHSRATSVGRYYDPGTGQFLSVDPLVDETGQPYAYTGGDPVNATDPTGRTDEPPGWAGGGNAVGSEDGQGGGIDFDGSLSCDTYACALGAMSPAPDDPAQEIAAAEDARAYDYGAQGGAGRQLFRTGSETDGALSNPDGVSFRTSISSSADGVQTFEPGAKIWSIDKVYCPRVPSITTTCPTATLTSLPPRRRFVPRSSQGALTTFWRS